MKKSSLKFTAFILTAIPLMVFIAGEATAPFLLFWCALAVGFWVAYFLKKDA